MLSNATVISWEDATEATITHVDNVGLKFNLPITLSNDESISNVDDTEITFVGTEAISLDLDTGTANVVEWKNRTTSTTGVTTMSFAALNLATTGTILGGINIISGTTDFAVTAAQAYGSAVFASAAIEIDLPAGASGMAILVYSTGANEVLIDPNGSEVIVLNGTAESAGERISIATGAAAGDFISLVHNGTNWYTIGRSGTWTGKGS
jgi:hypothetical protein